MSQWRLIVLLLAAVCLTLFSAPATVGDSASPAGGAASSSAEDDASTRLPRPGPAVPGAEPAEAWPEPAFIGTYRPDGRFTTPPKRGSSLLATNSDSPPPRLHRPEEVPPWIDLRDRSETVIEDYAPPAHARKSFHKRSRSASLLESIAAFAYGRQAVLHHPTHVATDSRRRVILSDPLAPAVHLLDGTRSFRIAGGPERRLRRPNGIAVDDQDNIYVADSASGLVSVYDPEGRFLHNIGSFRGESMFQEPAGIAIDRAHRRLYVLDSPAAELIVLDLDGHVLQRVGGLRHLGGVEFDLPREIAVGDSAVVVLDSYGSRLLVFDLQCHLLKRFPIRGGNAPPKVVERGLALDSDGNIYVSNGGSPALTIYRQDGRVLGGFGRFGQRDREFNAPSGLWIDASDRVYVADTNNSRIQVFQRIAGADVPKEPAPERPSQPGSSAVAH